MKLRDYQEECIDTMISTFEKSNQQLIQLPTGSGKTFIFMNFLKRMNKRALIICPSLELNYQVEETALNLWHRSEVSVKEGQKNFRSAKVMIMASANMRYENLRNFLKDVEFDYIIFDEAHKAQCSLYLDFIKFYTFYFPNVKIAGFTATPERMDRKPLLDIFKTLSFERNIIDMVNSGYLCDLESFRIDTRCVLKICKGLGNDFGIAQLKNLNNESRNKLLLKVYAENCMQKKTLIFCLSVEHSVQISNYLKSKGVKSGFIHGSMKIEERKEILQRFKNGEIQVLTNCQLLTEGFDESSIEALIIARPTKSKSLYCQMIGRGLRLHEGKKVCYLYELTDNSHRICTFNILATDDTTNISPYRDGLRLSELKDFLKESEELKEIELNKKKIFILQDFPTFLGNHIATESLLETLNKQNISYMEPISILEASFLIWKKELIKKYGIYKEN